MMHNFPAKILNIHKYHRRETERYSTQEFLRAINQDQPQLCGKKIQSKLLRVFQKLYFYQISNRSLGFEKYLKYI